MKKLRVLSASLLILAAGARATRAASAQTSAGASSFVFLLFDANARAVGLGGAYTALATDANALLYNPAGLGMIERSEGTFMHDQYVQGLTQEYLSLAAKQGWGANVNYLNLGGVGRATYSQPDGLGANTGLTDLAFSGGYGHAFGAVAVGGALKVLREEIDNVNAVGVAADAGVLYLPPQVKGLSLGASLQNVGPDVKFAHLREKLPTQLRAGAGYSFATLGAMQTLAFDLSKERTDKVRLGVGIESVLGKMMAMRVGFTTRNDAGIGITGGVGWMWKDFSIDYAIVPFDTLGVAHRVSLTFKWGESGASNAPQR